jgi:hypothetical protein
MPEFKGSLTETQIWQVTVLVKNADKLPPAVRSDISSPPPPPNATSSSAPPSKP